MRGIQQCNMPQLQSAIRVECVNVIRIAAGTDPVAVAVNSATNTVYVANAGSNNVTVINGATNTVAATIATGAGPNAIAINQIANRLYVTDKQGGGINVINGATNGTVILGAGTTPVSIALNPVTNKSYIINQGSNNVTVYDCDTNSLVTSVSLPGSSELGSAATAINPITNKLYMTFHGGSAQNVYVFDGATNLVAPLNVSNGEGLAVNPATNTLYVVCASGIAVVDGNTDSLITTVNFLGKGNPAVNPVTNKIYVLGASSAGLGIIDGSDNSVTTLAISNGPSSVAVNPLTNKVYTANGDGTATVIDAANGNSTTTVRAGISPSQVVVNPITNKIYIENFGFGRDGGASVTEIDGVTNAPSNIAISINQPIKMAINTATNKLYLLSAWPTTIALDNLLIIDLTTGSQQTIASGPAYSEPVDIVPDPATGKVYVLTSYNLAVVDGITNVVSTVLFPSIETFGPLAIDPITKKIYVNAGNKMFVYAAQTVNPVPPAVSIEPLPGDQTASATPSVTFSTPANADGAYFQVDSQLNSWSAATGSEGTFTGTTPPLQPGFHILYSYATEGQEGTISQSASSAGAPVTGSIQAYGFVVAQQLLPQEIAFNTVPTQVQGPTVQLYGTATSGLPVSFTSSTPAVCVILGSEASLIGAGTCTITASQAGDELYAPAPSVTQSFTVTPRPLPTAVSVSPGSGSGRTQTFTAVFTDPNGLSELSVVKMLVSAPQFSGTNACIVWFKPSTNALSLSNDADSGTTGPVTPGFPFSLSNTQCTLFAGSSWSSISGTTLTVGFNLTFSSAFTGPRNIFLQAVTNSGVSTGWVQRGSWTPSPAGGPTTVSLSPSSGAGIAQTFTAVYSDAAGVGNFSTVRLLFSNHPGISGIGTCVLEYDIAGGGFYLWNNDHTVNAGPLIPGSSSSLSNSQCTLSGSGSSATASGNTLTVKYALTFAGSFQDSKDTYLQANSIGGYSTDWLAAGTWTPSSAGSPHASLSPTYGTALTQTFTAVYSDPNSYGDLSALEIMFDVPQYTGVNACVVSYQPATDSFYLWNDQHTVNLGPLAPAAASSLSNSQCSLQGTRSSVSINTTTGQVTVNFGITFSSTFAGAKYSFVQLVSRSGSSVSTGWLQQGVWTPNPLGPPSLVSLSPDYGAGQQQVFTGVYSDPNGIIELNTVALLFSASAPAVTQNACEAQYDLASGSFYLYNDSHTVALGPLKPGSSSSLSNSQCTLSGQGSTAAIAGNVLTVTYALTFADTYAGVNYGYLNAVSVNGYNSGFTQEGIWAP